MAAATSLSPAQRTERARKAALARTSIDAHVRAVVAALNEQKITAEDRARMSAALEAAAR